MVRGLVWFVLFGVASLAFYRVNDRIVWDVCRRERRPYPQAWTFSPYWQWRTIIGGWYTDAKRAGRCSTSRMLKPSASRSRLNRA